MLESLLQVAPFLKSSFPCAQAYTQKLASVPQQTEHSDASERVHQEDYGPATPVRFVFEGFPLAGLTLVVRLPQSRKGRSIRLQPVVKVALAQDQRVRAGAVVCGDASSYPHETFDVRKHHPFGNLHGNLHTLGHVDRLGPIRTTHRVEAHEHVAVDERFATHSAVYGVRRIASESGHLELVMSATE